MGQDQHGGGKVWPTHHCDGINHRWGYSVPIKCLGCGHAFTDLSDLGRIAAHEALAQKDSPDV